VGDFRTTPLVRVAALVIITNARPAAPEVYERGVAVALVDVVRNTAVAQPVIKSNNLLNNALAMQQA